MYFCSWISNLVRERKHASGNLLACQQLVVSTEVRYWSLVDNLGMCQVKHTQCLKAFFSATYREAIVAIHVYVPCLYICQLVIPLLSGSHEGKEHQNSRTVFQQ